jgi:TolB protein
MRKLTLSLAATAVTAAVTLLAASAAPPGQNGQIVFRRWLDAHHKTSALFVINPDGTGERQLTRPLDGVADVQPDWSPDGSSVVFERDQARSRLWTVAADGTEPFLLGPTCLDAPPKCEDHMDPAWSPDGKTLAFWRAWGPVNQKLGFIAHSEVFTIDDDGTHLRQLTHSSSYADDDRAPAWSPDGKQLVFERLTSPQAEPPDARALFVINADGSGARQVTPWSLDGGDHPDWSPDGRWILFHSNPDNGATPVGGDLYLVHPDGTGLRQLTHFNPMAVALSASFSPDGKSIVYSSVGVGGQPDLYVMRVDGTDVRQLTRTRAWESQPDWGTDR